MSSVSVLHITAERTKSLVGGLYTLDIMDTLDTLDTFMKYGAKEEKLLSNKEFILHQYFPTTRVLWMLFTVLFWIL